ncbi:pyridoxamine 5'-phosphate oxidase family protein [Streptomyces verrucosisporus]|uniref:pyridoxamine 5'-phosphate oxidase family protein n=1 Tax=Streptomyces verrucosisporus TaxID=1695161 RepID=UPI0019D1AD3E|nr:pyridoxamine 5'-phosphate oxidase family protein [Streptomyces verrucosisporus]MBN3928854.1 pyridoxamine 5'-phosphate oxidase family protein [Streptomyces verrucosisporus]
MSTPGTGLSLFAGERRVWLATYDRQGVPVGTATAIAVEGDRAYVRAHGRSGTAERLRRRPEAEISPATLGGTPAGAPMKVDVRRLSGREARHAAGRLAREHPARGVLVPLGHRLMLDRSPLYELRPVGER